MENQAAFVLLAFLYLASPLATVQAVTKIKVLAVGGLPLALKCENHTGGDIVWMKEGVDVRTAFSNKEDIVKIVSDNGTLEILKVQDNALGDYSCNSSSSSSGELTFYRVVPKPTAHLAHSVSVVEGEKLHLICESKTNKQGIKISWIFAGKTYNTSEGRVRLSRDDESGINRAVLNVENIEMSDRGNVSCYAAYDWSDINDGNYAKADSLLRVKDKLAALWPFLGICAEVVVLCAIILIYEKKRNKAELEESDTDQSPDTKPTPNKDSDVRQRK